MNLVKIWLGPSVFVIIGHGKAITGYPRCPKTAHTKFINLDFQLLLTFLLVTQPQQAKAEMIQDCFCYCNNDEITTISD